MSQLSLTARDLNTLWHPCSQMKDYAENIPLVAIERAEGVWLIDYDGRRYLDAISSWWVNIFGHQHPEINSAIKKQVDQLEHVLLAGFTHQPVIDLSEKLVALTPPGLSRCFYADNGSSAVEIALKMSFHYWQNVGQRQKQKFVYLNNGYHGETLATLAVSGNDLYKKVYEPLLMPTYCAPSPDCRQKEPGETWADCSKRLFAGMENILQEHANEIAAVIVEPLLQCAGGMLMYDPSYLRLLRAACDRYQVHFIADEIATGFGRTGSLFACQQADVTPDFMCLSKGLTGGYLPLSVVLTQEAIYDAFYDDYQNLKAFMHSHSYTGNPIACAAANATLTLFEKNNVIENNQQIATQLHEASQRFKDHPHVAHLRQQGMVVAFDLIKDKNTRTPYPWQQRRGLGAYRHALQQGVILRPLGDTIYFMPPLPLNTEIVCPGFARKT